MKVKRVEFTVEFVEPVDIDDSWELDALYDALENLQRDGVIADHNMSSAESPEVVANKAADLAINLARIEQEMEKAKVDNYMEFLKGKKP